MTALAVVGFTASFPPAGLQPSPGPLAPPPEYRDEHEGEDLGQALVYAEPDQDHFEYEPHTCKAQVSRRTSKVQR